MTSSTTASTPIDETDYSDEYDDAITTIPSVIKSITTETEKERNIIPLEVIQLNVFSFVSQSLNSYDFRYYHHCQQYKQQRLQSNRSLRPNTLNLNRSITHPLLRIACQSNRLQLVNHLVSSFRLTHSLTLKMELI